MDVLKHVLDTPKNRGVVFVMLLFEVLPFTEDTIRHDFLSSFTVYRHETSSPKGNDAHLRVIIQSEKKWKHQFFRRLRAANSVVRGRI